MSEEILALGTVPIVLILVQVAKTLVPHNSKLWPVLAICIAVTIHLFLAMAAHSVTRVQIFDHLLQGLLIGLAASGLYSGVREIRKTEGTPTP